MTAIYLEKIKIIDNSFPSNVLKKGFEINCSDINLLVGNQGCGKSSLLKMLQQNNKDLDITLSKETLKNGVNSYYFDSERDNPRTKNPEKYTDIQGNSMGYGYANALASNFKSHGEILTSLMINPLLKARDCIVLLDEPESGLSITNQFKLINAIKTAVKNGCQLFIATHCYPLIQNFDVISLEHNQQLKGTDFIKKIRK